MLVPVQTAVNHNIPLIFYAEHGESEYGGKTLHEDSKKMRGFTEVLEHQIGDMPLNWVDDEVEERDLAPYLYPDLGDVDRVGVKAMYFGYFFPWDVYENYELVRSAMDFRVAERGRTDGTFTNFDSLDDTIDDIYYYLQFIKFGFGRSTRDASRQIYRGRMSREEALTWSKNTTTSFPRLSSRKTSTISAQTSPSSRESWTSTAILKFGLSRAINGSSGFLLNNWIEERH